MIKKIVDTSIESEMIEDITFVLTENCIFNCKYCPLIKKNNKLNFRNIKNKVDKLFRDLSSLVFTIPITFFGGEPLINKEFILDFLDFLEESYFTTGSKLKFVLKICTNGFIYDHDFLSFLYNMKLRYKDQLYIEFNISIDLLSSIHDKNRLTNNGLNTYSVVIKNFIKLYKNYGNIFYIGINSVLGIDIFTTKPVIDLYIKNIIAFSSKISCDFIVLMPEMLTSKKIKEIGSSFDGLLENYNIFLHALSKKVRKNNILKKKIVNLNLKVDITLPPIGITISPEEMVYLTRDYIFSMDFKDRIKSVGDVKSLDLYKIISLIEKIGLNNLRLFYLKQYLGDTYMYNKKITEKFNLYFGPY